MHYEQVTYSGGRIDQIHALYAGGEVIGQYTTTNQSGVPPASTRYFGTDPLGSIVVLTNEAAVSPTATPKTRGASSASSAAAVIPPTPASPARSSSRSG